MMSYINETDFVIENKELVYPEIITDGLQLYYDAKGKRDTDYHRDTMLDMSGNKNHGELQNFAYEKHSGYKDGLVFDYIDDKLVHPKLDGIDANNFTYQLNSNILAFTGGEVKTVRNGSVEVSGRNYWVIAESSEHYIRTWAAGILNREENSLSSDLIPTEPNERFSINYPVNQTVYFNKDKEYIGAFGSNMVTPNSGDPYTYYNASGKPTDDTPAYVSYGFRGNFMANNPDYRIMLAKGNISTNWIPAPEDLIETTELRGNILGDIENIIDGLYKTEVLSGEGIYTDKADDAVVHVEVDGKSYQHAGSGKNLFNLEKLKSLSPTSWATTARIYDFNLKENTKYTLSTNLPVGQNELYINGSTTNDRNVYLGKSLTIETDSSGEIYIAVASDRARSNAILNGEYWIQLEEGSTATEYELPGPTPDYPIEIHNLNDFDVVSSVGKENLLIGRENGNIALSSNNNTVNPAVFKSYEGYDSVTLVGGEQLSTYSRDMYTTEKGKEYTASMYVYSPITTELSITSYYGDVWTTVPANTWTRLSRTIVGTGERRRVPSLFSRNAEVLNHEIFYSRIKIEEGEISNYSPAPEDITENDNHPLIDKINLLLDEPLRSVGDVKDRLFRDSDGAWKIEQKVGETILDGSRRWSTEQKHFYIPASSLFGSTRKSWNYQSSHFQFGRSISDDGFSEGFRFGGMSGTNQTHNGNLIFYFPRASDSSKLEEWLSLNPVNLIFELENPRIKTLDQSLQDKLNNLRSFEDSNYVYTVLPDKNNALSKNLKPTLHAKFLYNNWYKEDRVINNLMIYNRALTNKEMLQNYKTIKRRWGM